MFFTKKGEVNVRGIVKIECDKCIEDIEIEIEGESLKTALNLSKIRNKLKEEGWHNLKTCLCSECKDSVGDSNCLNCKHSAYNDFNYRCKRELSEKGGIVIYDGSIVSEFDTCKYFENIHKN